MERVPVLLTARELHQGGCERDLTRLALGFQNSPFEPHVACFRSGGMRYAELKRAGIPVLDLQLRSFRSIGAFKSAMRLRRYARDNNIRLVHALDVPTAAFLTPVCRAFGVPAILSCQLSFRCMYARSERLLMSLADRVADRIVSNCQPVLDDLIADYGVRAEKTALIYNGVELDRFRPPPQGRDRGVLPRRVQDANVVIGTVCALRLEKRLDVLLRAFAEADPRRAGAWLVCVGSGAMEGDWKALAAKLAIDNRVHFEPATAQPERWMQAFDIYALPSQLESFPNGLLEGMACGCAPVASDVGGVKEMFGDAGIRVPPEDAAALAGALRRLIADPAEREALGKAAAQRAAECFSLENNLRATASLYSQALREKGVQVAGYAETGMPAASAAGSIYSGCSPGGGSGGRSSRPSISSNEIDASAENLR